MSGPLRGGANGRMDTLVATAPADVAGHGIIDLLVGWSRGFRQQRGRLHDLAGLAIAALRHADIAPRHLHGVLTLGIEPLDGGYRLAGNIGHDNAAGADCLAVEMNGAGPTERGATTEFRSGQAKLVAEVPHERHRRIAVEQPLLPIHM